MEAIESENICEELDDVVTREYCRVAVDGIMKKGFSNFFSYTYT
jgi:hypothetical protein